MTAPAGPARKVEVLDILREVAHARDGAGHVHLVGRHDVITAAHVSGTTISFPLLALDAPLPNGLDPGEGPGLPTPWGRGKVASEGLQE